MMKKRLIKYSVVFFLLVAMLFTSVPVCKVKADNEATQENTENPEGSEGSESTEIPENPDGSEETELPEDQEQTANDPIFEQLEQMKYAEIGSIAEGQEFLAVIEWENTEPLIVFKSPSGKLYFTGRETEDTQRSEGEKTLYYHIIGAETGEWSMYYDKLDNDTISVDLEEAHAPFVVGEVSVSNPSDRGVTVGFNVEYSTDIYINYRISVTANRANTGEVVYEGSAYANQDVSVDIDMTRFGSSTKYYVYVYAYFKDNGMEINAGSYSQEFSYINPNLKDFETPVKLEIYPNETKINLHFEKRYGYNYLIAVYENEGTEPVTFVDFGDDAASDFVDVYDSFTKTLHIEIRERYFEGVYSNPKVFDLSIGALPDFTFEAAEVVGKNSVRVDYSKVSPDMAFLISVNEKAMNYTLSDAAGGLNIQIEPGDNYVRIIYLSSEDVSAIYDKTVTFDNIPPNIYMLQNYSNITTMNPTYEVAGTVTDCERFEIGGKIIELDAYGTFIHTLDLKKGENEFDAIAYDFAGNKAVYKILINLIGELPTPTPVETAPGPDTGNDEEPSKGPDKTETSALDTVFKFLPAIITFILGIVLIIMVLVLGKKKKSVSKLANLSKVMAYLLGLSAVFAGFSFYKWYKTYSFVNSFDFIELSYKSIEEANGFLDQEKLFKILMFAGLIALGVFLIALLTVLLIAKVKAAKNAKKGQNTNVPEEAMPLEKTQETIQTAVEVQTEATVENVEKARIEEELK